MAQKLFSIMFSVMITDAFPMAVMLMSRHVTSCLMNDHQRMFCMGMRSQGGQTKRYKYPKSLAE